MSDKLNAAIAACERHGMVMVASNLRQVSDEIQQYRSALERLASPAAMTPISRMATDEEIARMNFAESALIAPDAPVSDKQCEHCFRTPCVCGSDVQYAAPDKQCEAELVENMHTGFGGGDE